MAVKKYEIEILHIFGYGHPACAIIENEYGVTPLTCLSDIEVHEIEKQKRLKVIHQSQVDSEQHYDIDGVSVNDNRVIVASSELRHK